MSKKSSSIFDCFKKQKQLFNEVCDFCHNSIHLFPCDVISSDGVLYYYKIIGIGKYNNKIICQNCLINKINKTTENRS